MKRQILFLTSLFVFILFLGNGLAYSQATFKMSFKFYIEGKSYPPGEYRTAQKDDKNLAFQKVGGEEVLIPFVKKLEPPETPIEGPQIIFDMVGNFEPSYTEYITDYVMAEVWLSEKDGFLVITTERAEYHKEVKGVIEKK